MARPANPAAAAANPPAGGPPRRASKPAPVQGSDADVNRYLAAYIMGVANRLANGASNHYRTRFNMGMSEWRAMMAIGTSSHRIAMLRNMAASLIKHEQITTGVAKAKELRPYVEKLITLAKKGGLSNRRLAQSRLMDDAQLAKLFDVLATRYADRNGGYTRIIKAGYRASDASPMAIIELVDRDMSAKGQDSGPVMGEDDMDEAA